MRPTRHPTHVPELPSGLFRSLVLFLVAAVLLAGTLVVRIACRPRKAAPPSAADEAPSRRERDLGPHRRAQRPPTMTLAGAPTAEDDPTLARAGDPPRAPRAVSGIGDGPGRPTGAPGGRAGAGPAPPAAAHDGEDDLPPTIWPVTRDGIQGAMRERIEEVKECYEGWLAVEPDLAGAVTVGFRIEAADGGQARVADVDISVSDLHHPWLEGCILAMIGSLSFENPEGEAVTVRYPFRFAPGPGKDSGSNR